MTAEHAPIPPAEPPETTLHWRNTALPGLLLVLTAMRLVVAGVTPLAPDEAYYWVWSRALAPGYLDHPPMVALWIWLGTAVFGPIPLGVRLLAPLSAAFGSLLLADAADRLLPGRNAGFVAAALLNATLLFGVGAVIMTPDTPLLFFWTACLWALARIVTGGTAQWWLLAGLFAGLAMASKYTAALLIAGVGLWLLWTPAMRRWLARPTPWLGALTAGVVFLPVVRWNASHDWASFVRQGGRVQDWQPDRAVRFLGELVGGQFGLATPLVFVLCVAGGVLAVRQAWRSRDAVWSLLAALILPGVLVFLQHALGDRVQGNWPCILYPAAAIAAAGLDGVWLRRLFRPALALGLVITLLAYAQAAVSLVPLPARLDLVGRQLVGWRGLAAQLAELAAREGAREVVSTQYAVASELAFILPRDLPVVGVAPRWALFELPRAEAEPGSALLLWPARDAPPDAAIWPGARLVGVAERGAAAAPFEVFQVYRVDALPADVPAVRLPRQ